jgi:hypothetical protein
MRTIPDSDAVCGHCRWRGAHDPNCRHAAEPWPTIQVEGHPTLLIHVIEWLGPSRNCPEHARFEATRLHRGILSRLAPEEAMRQLVAYSQEYQRAYGNVMALEFEVVGFQELGFEPDEDMMNALSWHVVEELVEDAKGEPSHWEKAADPANTKERT